jgi:hypothetical protein
MMAAQGESNERQDDSSNDEFEQIGTINFIAEFEHRKRANSPSLLVDQSQSKHTEAELNATHQMSQRRQKVKSLSYNGSTLQELQVRRNQLRVESFFHPHVISPMAKENKRHDDFFGAQPPTSLPAVRDDTRRELLRLNQRYAPRQRYLESTSQVFVSSQAEVRNQPQQHSLHKGNIDISKGSKKDKSNHLSPFKLILHGIGDSNMSLTSNAITPDSQRIGRNESDGEAVSLGDNYLYQLTQLARDSDCSRNETNIDDEASSSESTSSSYASPTPHLQAASPCNSHAGDEDIGCDEGKRQKSDEDSEPNNFSCLCKPTTTETDFNVSKLFRNRRMKSFLNFMKHAMIILGIALVCGCIELAKEKIVYCVHTSLRWMVSLIHAWSRFLQDKVTVWLHALQWTISLVSAQVEFLRESASSWHQSFMQRILPLMSLIRQTSSSNLNTTRALFRSLTLSKPDCLTDLLGKVNLQNKRIFLSTKHVSGLLVRDLASFYSDLAHNFDFTSTVIEGWFKMLKLQIDCRLFLCNALESLREMQATFHRTWNATIVIVSLEWHEFVLNTHPPHSNRPIILKKSTTTKPISFPLGNSLDSLDSWLNQTMESKTTIENSKSTHDGVKSSFSLLRAPPYKNIHNPDHFRRNAQLILPPEIIVGIDDLLSRDHLQELGGVQDIHRQRSKYSISRQSDSKNDMSHTDRLSSKKEARKHYDSSFPTFPIDPRESARDDNRDGFDLNLMDMATELTKRLIPRRRKHREAT